ncbi:hypothetical protein HDU98_011265 [Podochytrium sp. JEL0797]|nr:hypothetical protein HDU98_011265 [Podochytrium sp. JEL0797]
MQQGLIHKIVPSDLLTEMDALQSRPVPFVVKGWRGGATDAEGKKVKGGPVAYEICAREAIALWERLDGMISTARTVLPPTMQTLTIHGEADEIVPAADALLFDQLLPLHSLVLIPSGNHNLTSKEDGPEGRSHTDVSCDAIVGWLRDTGLLATTTTATMSKI